MFERRSGFTIVELLITIVVISILASITIVAYNGVQNRALNTARLAEVKAWKKEFQLYQAAYGHFPATTAGTYCLGSGFPGGKCRDYTSSNSSQYYLETNSNGVTIMNELAKIGTLPSGTKQPAGAHVGPYVDYTSYDSWGIYIADFFTGATGSCPSGMEEWWHNTGENVVLCADFLSV